MREVGLSGDNLDGLVSSIAGRREVATADGVSGAAAGGEVDPG